MAKKKNIWREASNSVIVIPKDLEDCYKQLNKTLWKKKMESTERDTPTGPEPWGTYHHSLGLLMRNNWGLWNDSQLSKYFKNMGIKHPDDMSGIILHGYWCYLKKIKYDLQLDIESYKKYWKDLEGNKNG